MNGDPDDNSARPPAPGRHAAAETGRRIRRTGGGAHASAERREQRLREAVALKDDDLQILGRSAKFWGAWIAGLIFLISAALGGLKSAATPAPADVKDGVTIDAGQFTVKVLTATVRQEPATSLLPSQLRLLTSITLTDDRGTTDARTDIITLSGFAGLKAHPQSTYDPRDDSPVTLIPGHAVPVAYSWDLPKKPEKSVIPGSVTVEVSDLTYIHSALISGYSEWLVHHPVARLRLPVAVTKAAE